MDLGCISRAKADRLRHDSSRGSAAATSPSRKARTALTKDTLADTLRRSGTPGYEATANSKVWALSSSLWRRREIVRAEVQSEAIQQLHTRLFGGLHAAKIAEDRTDVRNIGSKDRSECLQRDPLQHRTTDQALRSPARARNAIED